MMDSIESIHRFRPRLRGTNLKLDISLDRKRYIVQGFRPRLRGTNLKLD